MVSVMKIIAFVTLLICSLSSYAGSISITKPTDDQAVWAPVFEVEVQIETDANVKDVIFKIDNKIVTPERYTENGAIIFILYRGTHTLQASIGKGKSSIKSKPVTFHVLKTSVHQRRRIGIGR